MPKLQISYTQRDYLHVRTSLGSSKAYGFIRTVESRPAELYLHEIRVERTRLRRQGIGSMLLKAYVEAGMARGAELFTTTPATELGVAFFQATLGNSTVVALGEWVELPIELAYEQIQSVSRDG